jgi:hypothetical protein
LVVGITEEGKPMNIGLHGRVDDEVQEHGRDWAVCLDCGAQWAVVDTNHGVEYEAVADGDGYCEDNAHND